MRIPVVRTALVAAAFGLAVSQAPSAEAALTLTAAGLSNGFSLSLFADGFPATGYCCGPLGVATSPNGKIIVQDYADGVNKGFNDVTGQTYASAVSSVPYASHGYGSAITNAGGVLYATHDSAGGYVERLNADGSFNSHLTTTGIGKGGIWTNPATGHLAVAGYNTIWDVDPATGNATLIVTADVDGVSVSPDGTVVYGAGGGHVYGWQISNGALVYDSGNIGSPDGTGIIQGNSSLAGQIIANGNDGTVHLLDPVLHTDTVIANGGSRGDYVGLDLNDGSLFLTQTDSVWKLGCGTGCGFIPPPPVATPEPASMLILGSSVLALGTLRRRRS